MPGHGELGDLKCPLDKQATPLYVRWCFRSGSAYCLIQSVGCVTLYPGYNKTLGFLGPPMR